jgi:hypothetical protein
MICENGEITNQLFRQSSDVLTCVFNLKQLLVVIDFGNLLEKSGYFVSFYFEIFLFKLYFSPKSFVFVKIIFLRLKNVRICPK